MRHFKPSLKFSDSYRRTYLPASYHIAQEIQKYNIPDYRPRQTQCAIFDFLTFQDSFYF